MNIRLKYLASLAGKDHGMILLTGVAVFLFVMIFQPFPIESYDFDHRLAFALGMGAIVSLCIFIVRVACPCLNKSDRHQKKMSKRHTILNTFFIFILSSVAIVFYFIFMGSTDLSILTLLKVFIICLAPPLVILIYDRMKELNLQNESLIPENESFINRTDKPRIEKENKFIEFISNSKTDKFSLPAGQVICLKSADNYVEVIYRENDLIRKKLIRNTLVNIEQKIVNFTSFVRCHRICIVNLNNVESFARNCNRYNLVLTGLNEKIPVSQQYFIKVKMALSNA